MEFIVFDLEFNQDFESLQHFERTGTNYPFEIIQFGAIRLDSSFHTVDTFDRLVKPTFYSAISSFIQDFTGITIKQLQKEATFPEVYHAFLDFLGTEELIFCVWGMSDMKELFRNVSYHNLDQNLLPKRYINIQPYVSLHLGLSHQKLLRLQYSVEALDIPIVYPFHNALNDAYYTAELFKKVYLPSIKPQKYDPSYTVSGHRPRQVKRIIDFDLLIKQFEKMYHREMTPEEQGIIKLAYQMGKTQQFLKVVDHTDSSGDHLNLN